MMGFLRSLLNLTYIRLYFILGGSLGSLEAVLMLAKQPRYDCCCCSRDYTEYAWHNKAHSCIMPKNPRAAVVEVYLGIFSIAHGGDDTRGLMLNGKREKAEEP